MTTSVSHKIKHFRRLQTDYFIKTLTSFTTTATRSSDLLRACASVDSFSRVLVVCKNPSGVLLPPAGLDLQPTRRLDL